MMSYLFQITIKLIEQCHCTYIVYCNIMTFFLRKYSAYANDFKTHSYNNIHTVGGGLLSIILCEDVQRLINL